MDKEKELKQSIKTYFETEDTCNGIIIPNAFNMEVKTTNS